MTAANGAAAEDRVTYEYPGQGDVPAERVMPIPGTPEARRLAALAEDDGSPWRAVDLDGDGRADVEVREHRAPGRYEAESDGGTPPPHAPPASSPDPVLGAPIMDTPLPDSGDPADLEASAPAPKPGPSKGR